MLLIGQKSLIIGRNIYIHILVISLFSFHFCPFPYTDRTTYIVDETEDNPNSS